MTVVGQHIGRYRLLEQVGSGGMSVVYRGLDTALEREVAVKVLHPHLARKEDSRLRLSREAKAVAKLQHPNILEVFDFAAADEENAYIVTEYIHGQTLAEYCARRPFDPPELAAMVIHQVASALAHAHEAGVIHRDLKPENVMIREDGVIKLTDFGIAKVIDRDDRMTITGALVGSPAHMAPEIIEGQAAGAEADVFSLGTILYFLATRQLPFAAPSTTAILKRILDGWYPDPRSVAPAISDELAAIIAMCLSRDPSARYPHAGKLRDAAVARRRPVESEAPRQGALLPQSSARARRSQSRGEAVAGANRPSTRSGAAQTAEAYRRRRRACGDPVVRERVLASRSAPAAPCAAHRTGPGRR